MIGVVISPSNLKMYEKCPQQFYHQYVVKDIPKKESAAMKRGTNLHALMEKACNDGWDAIKWPDNEMNEQIAKGFVDTVHKLKASGWKVECELEAATDGNGNVTDWWDKPPMNYMRSKIDVCCTHPNKDYATIIDWKTGKIYPEDGVQLAVNALCLYPRTKLTKYHVMFAYLDQANVVEHWINVDIHDPVHYVPTFNTSLAPVLDIIERMKVSYDTNDWTAKPNKFCRWCDIKGCVHHG